MIIDRFKQKFSNRFVRNFGWMGAAELANRVLRLATVVVLARLLNQYDYGLAAIVLTVNEFSTVLTLRVGISSKLIQASEKDLNELCETAYWMTWIASIGLFFIQCAASFPIAWFYGDRNLILPISVLALGYLPFPTMAVQFALINRENRLGIAALCNLLFAIISNLLTIVLAFMGWGMWAIVLPILLAGPVWITLSRVNHSWRPSKPFTLHRWREIASFAVDVVGVELLNKVRANIDYLLVGRFLGIEALGIYFFAFNAGLGTSINILNALTASLFPHLCEVRGQFSQLRKQFFTSLKTTASFMIPIVILQAALAPIYVPLIYGQKWGSAISILILICLSALPRPFAESASMLLQAVGKTRINLYWNVLFTAIFTLVLLYTVRFGITWVAASVLIVHGIALPMFTIWSIQFVLGKKSFLRTTSI